MGKLAAQVYRLRKWIIALWLACMVVAAFYAVKLPGLLSGSGFEMKGDAAKVSDILKHDFHLSDVHIIVFFEKQKQATQEQFKTDIEHTLIKLKGSEGLLAINSPYDPQANGMIKNDTAYAVLSFNKEHSEMKSSIQAVKANIHDTPNVKVGLTGAPIIDQDMSEASQNDLKKSEMIGLPIALIVLIFAFGGLAASAIPLMVALSSVVTTMGLLYFAGEQVPLSIFLLNIVPMIGIALGIDFALLLVNRYKEELSQGDVRQAVIRAMETAGRSVIFSGLCVFLGLSSMMFIRIDIFKTVALGGMAVVLLSVLSSITLLPAVLAVLGPNLNRFMIFKPKDGVSKWAKFASFVMKKPLMMTAISLLLLIIAITPVSNIRLSVPGGDALPNGYESKRILEKFNATYNEKNMNPVTFVYRPNGNLLSDKPLGELNDMVTALQKDPSVEKVDSLFSYAGNMDNKQILAALQTDSGKAKLEPVLDKTMAHNQTFIQVTLKHEAASPAAKDWVRHWMKQAGEHQMILGGVSKFNQEIFDEIGNKVGYGLSFVLISTYIILMLAFRSILIPLKAIIMNIISLSATFGILVWLFQEGHLGVSPSNITLIIPVLVFGLVFGLSMDYEVFLISRIHEVYLKTQNNERAIMEGLTSTSKIITAAAAIMIVVTGSFAFTGVMPVKQIGVGIALAIFIDATLVRMILVPSLMKLMGRWNWWFPGRQEAQKARLPR
ncbi:MAG: hypothetical protein JWR03_3180 [Cohnella sp.]|nr:hypothetical protein [Cohnella sp.]